MRADTLTHADMAQFMEKLAVNFGGKRDLEAKAELWYEKLRRFPLEVVGRVVDRLLAEEHQYFPLVGRALALAKDMAPAGGDGDQSLISRMRAWETDPWGEVVTLETDRQACTSAPCPICGSVVRFSDRGAVIQHDDQRHREMRVAYSNLGKPEWFDMAPPVLPENWRKLKTQQPLEPATLEQAMGRGQQIRSDADEAWEAEQMARAEAETAA